MHSPLFFSFFCFIYILILCLSLLQIEIQTRSVLDRIFFLVLTKLKEDHKNLVSDSEKWIQENFFNGQVTVGGKLDYCVVNSMFIAEHNIVEESINEANCR